MNIQELLFEKLLRSEFTFGFELEAICKNSNNKYKDITDLTYDLQSFINQYFKEDGKIQEDGSIKPTINIDYKNQITFEWASPVLNVTPNNISKTIKFLLNLNDNDIYTNDSCGFHVHISFPNISSTDMIWIITQLAFDDEMIKKISHLRKYNFATSYYAKLDFLTKIKRYVRLNKIASLNKIFSNDKYRLIRMHPQGTLEWRGPRDFLNNKPNKNRLLSFFILLIQFVDWINRARDKQVFQYENIKLDKKEYLSNFNNIILTNNETFSNKYKNLINKLNDNINLINKINDNKLLIKLFKIHPQWYKYYNNQNDSLTIKLINSVIPILMPMLISSIRNPSEKIQYTILYKNPILIKFIENPSPAILNMIDKVN